MNQPHPSADEIVAQATAISDPQQRSRFVAESCAGDPSLRRQVAARLGDPAASASQLQETTDGAPHRVDEEGVPAIGSRIGPYQLIEEIGEGGMGIVFLAAQNEPVRRRVALKVIKVGMDTRRVVARFETERQTLALMDHPCITKVLDAGTTENGRPYFVMELVQGEPITRFCDALRLPVRRRLEVFVQVCHALEHAHQKGIIHRDIKPTNVLVTTQDGTPLPKIIDFGIAKATAERDTGQSAVTQCGEMVGTPLYMSPEQADTACVDIDTRSDIYSLGVLLYELLTGSTPFEDLRGKGWHEIREAIRSREPQTASARAAQRSEKTTEIASQRATDTHALSRTLRGELDWILLKCLARDRERRYQSAGELARDVLRHLNGEPVEAAAPTFLYRMRKFVQKNRYAVAASLGAALLLAAVSIASSIMAIRNRQLADRATRAEQLAQQRLDEALQERDRAVVAEARLAEVERQQRNRVAMHEAAARINSRMLQKLQSQGGMPPVPGEQFRMVPLSQFLRGNFASDIPPNLKEGDADPGALAGQLPPPAPPEAEAAPAIPTPSDDPALQVVVMDDDENFSVDVLKSLLEQQQKAFGSDDIFVVDTLQALGETLAKQERLEESVAYLERAAQILEEHAQNHPEVQRIKERLDRALKQRGDPAAAWRELRSAGESLRKLDLKQEALQILDKIRPRIPRR